MKQFLDRLKAVGCEELPCNKGVDRRMNSSTNKDLEWDKFLGEVAREVDGLIIDADNLNEFRRQIHPFAEKWKNHISDCKEYDRTRRKHWENVKANPKWQDKQTGPPEEDWEWDRHYLFDVGFHIGPVYEMPAKHTPTLMVELEKNIQQNERKLQQYVPNSQEYQNFQEAIVDLKRDLANIRGKYEKLSSNEKDKGRVNTALSLDVPVPKPYFQLLWWRRFNLTDEEVFGCWRPPLKQIRPDPWVTLIPEKGKQSLPPVQSQEQEYERYYVVLTSIHDNMLTGFQSISKTIWPTELADSVWFRFTRGQPYGPDKPFIEAALERVKTDRARTEGNKRSIITWIVEVIIVLALIVICLYFFGVVTGIFVFAALLAVFDYLGWLKPIKEFIYSILSPR